MGAEDGIAQSCWLGLHHIGKCSGSELAAEVLENVGLPCTDDEADAIGTAANQSFDQVFTHCTWTLDVVQDPAAHRQQFLREREWLNATAAACGRDNAPHGSDPP